MNDPKIKSQIADKIKNAANILVTVSTDPSVDALSAALGLTLLINKLDKHGTAIFSGAVPPAITFLEPEKTFEGTTDSLRDFIIALDKEKADHLRYKLEGDLVKIYITPYRSTITSDDLTFSQGDYNVELVIALGVENKTHLDQALAGHGRILHDATVVTLTAGEQTSDLGSLDWHDSNASSLSEMLVSLSETMKLEKGMLDQPIATAWLTGIVAATERFSNIRTSSRTMTIAAQLMAAGADQQLIATRLADAEPSPTTSTTDGILTEGKSEKLTQLSEPAPAPPKPKDELVISHEKEGSLDEVAREVASEELEQAAKAAEQAIEREAEQQAAGNQPAPSPAVAGALAYTPPAQPASSEPVFGGVLNATTDQAEEDARRAIEHDKNKVILSHSMVSEQAPAFEAAMNGAVAAAAGEQPIDIFSTNSSSDAQTSSLEPDTAPTIEAGPLTPPSELTAALPTPELEIAPPSAPQSLTLAELDAQQRGQQSPAPQDDARAAVDAALAASLPLDPPAAPLSPFGDIPLPPPPPLPTDFSGLPPLPPSAPAEPQILGDILAPPAPTQAPTQSSAPTPSPLPPEPGQFRIPGQ